MVGTVFLPQWNVFAVQTLFIFHLPGGIINRKLAESSGIKVSIKVAESNMHMYDMK